VRWRLRPVLGGLALAAATLAAGAPTPTPSPTPSPLPLSVRWKATVTSSEAKPGDKLQVAEIWMDGRRMRIEDRTAGTPPIDAIVNEAGTVFLWQPGSRTGSRVAAGLMRRSARPRHDYALRIPEIRARGKVTGTEKLDGHLCDVIRAEGPEGVATYWLARDLRDFPLRILFDRPVAINPYRGTPLGRVTLDYRNSDVRMPSGIDPARYTPPSDVRFDDMNQLFLRVRPTATPSGAPSP